MVARVGLLHKLVIAACALSLAGLFGSHAADAQTLTLATWGGTFAEAFNKNAHEQFKKETGIDVQISPGVSMSNYQKLAAQRDNPQIDIVIIAGERINVAAREGLLEPFTAAEVPNIKNVLPASLGKSADGKFVYAGVFGDSVILAYRPDLVPFKITKWADLWDPRLKKKVAIASPKLQEGRFLLIVNRLAGGTETNVEPGFKRLKELGQNLAMISDNDSEMRQALAQGEIWVAPLQMSGTRLAIEKGAPFAWVAPEEGATTTDGLIAVVKGSPRAAAAKKYVDFLLREDVLKRVAISVNQLPLLEKPGEMPPEAAKFTLTAADMGKLHAFDYAEITKGISGWIERYQRELGPIVAK